GGSEGYGACGDAGRGRARKRSVVFAVFGRKRSKADFATTRFRPEGRVPFGTARKEPKGGLGAQPRLNSGQRASPVRRACPLRTPVLRGSKTGAAFSYRRTPADSPSDARRPP